MDNSLYVRDEMKTFKAIAAPPHPPTFIFKGKDDLEILRLEPNGDIYIRGTLAENDKQVTDGLRQFLSHHGY